MTDASLILDTEPGLLVLGLGLTALMFGATFRAIHRRVTGKPGNPPGGPAGFWISAAALISFAMVLLVGIYRECLQLDLADGELRRHFLWPRPSVALQLGEIAGLRVRDLHQRENFSRGDGTYQLEIDTEDGTLIGSGNSRAEIIAFAKALERASGKPLVLKQ